MSLDGTANAVQNHFDIEMTPLEEANTLNRSDQPCLLWIKDQDIFFS